MTASKDEACNLGIIHAAISIVLEKARKLSLKAAFFLLRLLPGCGKLRRAARPDRRAAPLRGHQLEPRTLQTEPTPDTDLSQQGPEHTELNREKAEQVCCRTGWTAWQVVFNVVQFPVQLCVTSKQPASQFTLSARRRATQCAFALLGSSVFNTCLTSN